MFGIGIAEVVVLFVIVPLYFLPSFIARQRKHQNSQAIFVTNLLLGWTFLGWVAALIWSYTAVIPVAQPHEGHSD
jgi:RsiW-degrading membrane proteinase PrsW (M82 family)